jgi:hypothetical protein
MKILLSCSEGFQLSETSKVIYSPGYESSFLTKTEHECLCIISRLVETRLTQEGHIVLARRHDSNKNPGFLFDRGYMAKGQDLAVMLALNNSQHNSAQFSTVLISPEQDGNTRNLFDGFLYSLGRYMPVQSRYPNQLRRIPFLASCQRLKVPAIVVLPFFITDKSIDDAKLGIYLEAAARAISEAILAFKLMPSEGHPLDVTEY